MRLIECRHVVCLLCAESSTNYFPECPVCAAVTPAVMDPEHFAVLKYRETLPAAQKEPSNTSSVPSIQLAQRRGSAVSRDDPAMAALKDESDWTAKLERAEQVRECNGGSRAVTLSPT